MLTMNSYNHPFGEKRLHMRQFIDFFARQGINNHFEVSGKQPFSQFNCAGVAKPQLKSFMSRFEGGDQINDLVGGNCTHNAELGGIFFILLTSRDSCFALTAAL